MRPEILFPLFADSATIKGVGARTKSLITRLAGARIIDLVWHLPTSLIDRRYRPDLKDAQGGSIATLQVTVGNHSAPPRNSRAPYRVRCFDDTDQIDLVFFRPHRDWLQKQLPEGETRIISGRVEDYNGKLQMTHPDHIVSVEEAASLPLVEPVYPLTAGLSAKMLSKAIDASLSRVPELPEWLDEALRVREKWPAWRDAVMMAHAPESETELSPLAPARARIAYDELLANQLALSLVRAHTSRKAGRATKGDGGLREKILDVLPYTLTGAQDAALGEIIDDLAADAAMLRLVQGDVGSGKTIVALLACAGAVEAGRQAAILAPTEILARQHLESLTSLCEAAGIRIAILTGRNKGKAREKLLAALSAGEIDILVGTHALIEGDVRFADLALAIIDEQHRFGVFQRMALAEKATVGVDMLVMSATPIPRTLTLTVYGDMDVSRITEKPPGRKPIDTRVVSLDRLEAVADGLGRAIAAGQRAYWVCPLVSESEVMDLAAAEERFAHLKARFGAAVGLVHGKMRAAEKDAVMADFASGKVQILVATTVIEVGVDVPEATIMVIEHAERFGLAQLHQLRGRVGRGADKSSCILLRAAALGETARARLSILRETEDGFRIAEEDLRLRGAGELLGTRQSGLPEFRVADLAHHADLLATARDDARLVLKNDPELKAQRGSALRTLLYLFERDAAVKYFKSG